MEIIRNPRKHTLSVRYRTAASKLPETMGPVFGEIAAFMGRKGIPFAGPPFALYYNELMAFLAEKKEEAESFLYEEYLNSPEDTPPEKLATKICFPLKG